jgi:hypothetical protein
MIAGNESSAPDTGTSNQAIERPSLAVGGDGCLTPLIEHSGRCGKARVTLQMRLNP